VPGQDVGHLEYQRSMKARALPPVAGGGSVRFVPDGWPAWLAIMFKIETDRSGRSGAAASGGNT